MEVDEDTLNVEPKKCSPTKMQGISLLLLPKNIVARVSIENTMIGAHLTKPEDEITVTSSEEETIRIESCEEIFSEEV